MHTFYKGWDYTNTNKYLFVICNSTNIFFVKESIYKRIFSF